MSTNILENILSPEHLEKLRQLEQKAPKQKVHLKQIPEWWFYKNNISRYKVTCPHCGKKTWAGFFCNHCGKQMYEIPYTPNGEDIDAQKSRDLEKARRLVRKWGYEVIKK